MAGEGADASRSPARVRVLRSAFQDFAVWTARKISPDFIEETTSKRQKLWVIGAASFLVVSIINPGPVPVVEIFATWMPPDKMINDEATPVFEPELWS